MFGYVDRLLGSMLLLGLTALVVKSLPDIRRYLRIRAMGDSRRAEPMSGIRSRGHRPS